MTWKEILFNPLRLCGVAIGTFLVYLSIFCPISKLLVFSNPSFITGFFKTSYFDSLCENFGWILIIYSLREMFWKIYVKDYKKFIPLMIQFFIIIFIYSIARQLKDSIVIPYIGVEGAQTCKMFVLVSVFFYQVFYSKMTRITHESKWILFAKLPIVIYFTIFAFCLMGNPHIVPSQSTILQWKLFAPSITIFTKTIDFTGLWRILVSAKIFDIIGIWPNVIYYIFAEIFAVSATMVWFWQTANKYVKKDEKFRYYGALMIAAQIAALNTGLVTESLSSSCSTHLSLSKAINAIILGLTIISLFVNHYFFNVVKHEEVNEIKKKTPSNLTIMQIIKKYPTSIFIALLTVFYGFSTLAVESFWKDKVKLLSIEKSKVTGEAASFIYSKMNGGYVTFQSRLAIIFALIMSNILPKLSWLLLSTITPLVMLFGSILLFGPLIFNFNLPMMSILETSFLGGYVMLALFKSLKYNAFDISKEIYVSSKEDDAKREIKNLEGMFGRVGKSGGAILIFVILIITNKNINSLFFSWFLFIVCSLMSILWIIIDFKLNKDLNKTRLQEEQNNETNTK